MNEKKKKNLDQTQARSAGWYNTTEILESKWIYKKEKLAIKEKNIDL